MNQRKRIALFLLVAFGLGVALMVGIFLSGRQKPLASAREVTKVHRDADGNVEYHVLTFGGGARIYWDYFDDGVADDVFYPHDVPKGYAPNLVFFTGWKSVKASGSWDQEWAQERFDHVLALAENGRLRYWEHQQRDFDRPVNNFPGAARYLDEQVDEIRVSHSRPSYVDKSMRFSDRALALMEETSRAKHDRWLWLRTRS